MVQVAREPAQPSVRTKYRPSELGFPEVPSLIAELCIASYRLLRMKAEGEAHVSVLFVVVCVRWQRWVGH